MGDDTRRGVRCLDSDLANEDGGLGAGGRRGDAELGAEVGDVGVVGLDDKALGGLGVAEADEPAGVQV